SLVLVQVIYYHQRMNCHIQPAAAELQDLGHVGLAEEEHAAQLVVLLVERPARHENTDGHRTLRLPLQASSYAGMRGRATGGGGRTPIAFACVRAYLAPRSWRRRTRSRQAGCAAHSGWSTPSASASARSWARASSWSRAWPRASPGRRSCWGCCSRARPRRRTR